MFGDGYNYYDIKKVHSVKMTSNYHIIGIFMD